MIDSAAVSQVKQTSWPGKTLGLMLRDPQVLVGVLIVTPYIIFAIFGPYLAPYEPTEFHIIDKLQPPSLAYPFGTDEFGRDIFSRIIYGSRIVLTLPTLATLLGVLLGVIIGLVTAYYGGMVDEIIMRVIDGFMAIPDLLLALLILATLGSDTINLVVAIGLTFAPMVARVVRSAALAERAKEYVEASLVRGESAIYIMVVDILPNVLTPIIVEGSLRMTYAILLIASLGFLGLGVQPPTPDWGLMASEGHRFATQAPWLSLIPTLNAGVLVIGVSLIAYQIPKLLKARE